MSTREARRFEAEGTPVEGGTSPANAPTIQPGSHADTIQTGETLFYRFEVSPGATLSASAICGRVTDEEAGRIATFFDLEIVDRFGDSLARDGGGGKVARDLRIRGIPELEVPEDVDELYLQVDIEAWDAEHGVGEFPLQLELDVTGGAPPEETPTPTEAASTPEAPPARRSGRRD